MFDKLRKAFSSAAKSIGQKEISAKVLDDTLLELQIGLLESDVAQEVVDSLTDNLKKTLLGLRLEKGQTAEEVIQSRFKQSIAEVFAKAGRLDIAERISAKKASKSGPFSIVFLGINGTGKTTTVAKIGNMLRKSGISVVVAAGDTHRAGAIEQLSQHCERLAIKVIAQRYGADPSAVGRDALEYARKHYIDVVLVDTAGRMQTSKNLMDEMAKIVRVVKPDMKLFIGDSLAGNDTINQAREFFQYTNFDGAVLTKVDADAKGGSAISIASITSKPIVYIGVGQGYDDIIPFNPDKFIETLFGAAADVTVESLMTPGAIQSPPEPAAEVQPPAIEPLKPTAERASKDERPIATQASSGPLFTIGSREKTAEEPRDVKPPETIPGGLKERGQTSPVQEQRAEEKDLPRATAEQPQAPEHVEAKPGKKSRFGFFGRKSSADDDKKEEKEKKKREEREREKRQEDLQLAEEPREEEKEVRAPESPPKKRKDDKDKGGQKDEVIYLSDEDIEDLLK
ncbi:MAG: signal recognition particle-docking protein FtsY [Nitrososphaera sp.]